MSQNQCLPLYSRKRGVWCKEDEEEEEEEEEVVEEGKEENEGKDEDAVLQKKEKNLSTQVAAITGSNIDNLQTMDAMDYLSMVHHEASLLPKVFLKGTTTASRTKKTLSTAKNTVKTTNRKNDDDLCLLPIDGSAATIYLSSRIDVLPPQQIFQLPVAPKPWINNVLADFSSLRQCLEQQQTVRSNNRIIPLPPLKDSGGWHEFCLGPQEAEGNIDGYFDDKEDNDDNEQDLAEDEEEEEEVPEWRRYVEQQQHANNGVGMKPSVSLLLQMDQVMTRRVLSHLISWVVEDNFPMSYQRALWIYALLARLEKPLHRNESALLRTILRTCCQLRAECTTTTVEGGTAEAHSSDNTALLPLLNVLIVIVGIYYEQGPQVMSLSSSSSISDSGTAGKS
jgi:survival of motor neuron protein-interacting protein 1